MNRRKTIAVLALIICLPVAISAVLHLQPMARDSHLKWKLAADGADIALRPDGGICVASEGQLSAYSSEGKELWSQSVPFSRPARRSFLESDAEGNVYLLLRNELKLFDLDGQEIWSFPTNPPQGAMVVFALKPNGCYVIVDGEVVSIDKRGKEEWRHKDVALVMSQPLVDSMGNLYYRPIYDISPPNHTGRPIIEWRAVCLDANGGKVWERKDGAEPLAIWNDRLYLATNNGLEYRSSTGKLIWGNPQVMKTFSLTVHVDGTAFALGSASQMTHINIMAVDQSGKVKWSHDYQVDDVFSATARGQPAILNDTLYVGASGLPNVPKSNILSTLVWSLKTNFGRNASAISPPEFVGNVFAIDLSTGQLKWSFLADDIMEGEVLADPVAGTVYSPGWHKHVYALRAD